MNKGDKNFVYNRLIDILYYDIKDFLEIELGKNLTYLEIAAILDFLSKHFRDNSALTSIVNMTDIMIKRNIKRNFKK